MRTTGARTTMTPRPCRTPSFPQKLIRRTSSKCRCSSCWAIRIPPPLAKASRSSLRTAVREVRLDRGQGGLVPTRDSFSKHHPHGKSTSTDIKNSYSVIPLEETTTRSRHLLSGVAGGTTKTMPTRPSRLKTCL